MRNNKLETNALISLLNVYLNEFEHRDQVFNSLVFKYFYAIVIVILLPNISEHLGINLLQLPIILFRIIGLLMSFVFLYLALCYSKRLDASSDTYRRMIEKLEPEYRRKSINSTHLGKLFSIRLCYTETVIMFFLLIAINVILMIFT